ncbi:MAG TPA: hypothetical protein VGK19_06290 [Capsulimonadaceae bacterium]
MEHELRARVDKSPANAEARRDLACCLVLLAMYQAGYEDHDENSTHVEPSAASSRPVALRSSSELFREHLWHLHVLKMLPSHKEVTASDYINLPSVLGMIPMTSEVKAKYELAFHRFLNDLQSSEFELPSDRH